jgi:hypothetical protein
LPAFSESLMASRKMSCSSSTRAPNPSAQSLFILSVAVASPVGDGGKTPGPELLYEVVAFWEPENKTP